MTLEWKNQKQESELKRKTVRFLKFVFGIAFASVAFLLAMGVLSNLLI